MTGRRIPWDGVSDPSALLTEAGDYCGPAVYYGDKPSVWFLLPIARDLEVPHPSARALHHVCSPPHVFTEEPDGTLTIRESIGSGLRGNYYWHGYLNHGCWELTKRD